MNPRERKKHHLDLALAILGALDKTQVELERVIRRHIDRVLDAADGNISLAATLLGMHRRSLQRYVRRAQKKRRRKATKR